MGTTLWAGIGAVLGSIIVALTVRRYVFFVTERVHRAEQIARGDIVVIESAELGRAIVKRVLGLPGDHIDIDRHGRVRINHVPVAEPYAAPVAGPAGSFDVPEEHLLLLGDNRTRSSDSRVWRQPFVPITAVRGKVLTATVGGSRGAAAVTGPVAALTRRNRCARDRVRRGSRRCGPIPAGSGRSSADRPVAG